jgi:hypothetical protein
LLSPLLVSITRLSPGNAPGSSLCTAKTMTDRPRYRRYCRSRLREFGATPTTAHRLAIRPVRSSENPHASVSRVHSSRSSHRMRACSVSLNRLSFDQPSSVGTRSFSCDAPRPRPYSCSARTCRWCGGARTLSRLPQSVGDVDAALGRPPPMSGGLSSQVPPSQQLIRRLRARIVIVCRGNLGPKGGCHPGPRPPET